MICSRAKSYLLTFSSPCLSLLHCPLLELHKLCRPVLFTLDQVPMDLTQSHLKSWLGFTPMALGMWMSSAITWPSHDNCNPSCPPRTPMWISPDHTQPCSMGLSQSHLVLQPNPQSEC